MLSKLYINVTPSRGGHILNLKMSLSAYEMQAKKISDCFFRFVLFASIQYVILGIMHGGWVFCP